MESFENTGYPEREVEGTIFLDVCASNDVFAKRGKNFFFDDETQIAVFRIDGVLYAVSNICPHQHAPVICDGYIEDLTVTCPLHGWIYSLETGKALGGGGRLRTYKVLEQDNRVLLEKPTPIVPKWTLGW